MPLSESAPARAAPVIPRFRVPCPASFRALLGALLGSREGDPVTGLFLDPSGLALAAKPFLAGTVRDNSFTANTPRNTAGLRREMTQEGNHSWVSEKMLG